MRHHGPGGVGLDEAAVSVAREGDGETTAVAFINAFIIQDGFMPIASHPSSPWSWHRDAAPAKTALECVDASVSADIVSGSLPGGTRITEGEVAERFQVSRTPVRESFLLLESQGLLQLFPKKGVVVTSTNPAETAQLLQVRVMLESRAVALQPGRAGAEQTLLNDLARIVEEQRDAASRADVPAFARVDHLFHARVVASSGNPIIDDFYAQLGPPPG